MNEYKIIFFSLVIIGIFISSLLLINNTIILNINNFDVYIPAVVNYSNFKFGILTIFSLRKEYGNGLIYISIPPIFLDNYESSIYSAKEIACNFVQNTNCNNYDYYININTNFLIEGFSDTAGLTLLFMEALLDKKPINNYPITGFMLPNGLIAPIGGLKYKLNATLKSGYNYLVAPSINNHILPSYTIFSILQYYYDINDSFSLNIDQKYIDIYNKYMQNVANEICQYLDNSSYYEKYYANNEYYVAASICFDQLVNNEKYYPNISNDILNYDINKLYNLTINYNCNGNFQCEQIKDQTLLRIEDANSTNNIQYKYYRYISAIGWYNLINISNYINLKNSCNFINYQYNIFQLESGDELPTNLSCIEQQDLLGQIYYYLVSGDPNYLNNISFNQIENLIYYYYDKNGFSVTSYNYLQLSKYLFEIGNYNESLYFLIQSLVYAT